MSGGGTDAAAADGSEFGIVRINEGARRLCQKHGFALNDLYALVADDIDALTVTKGNAILSKAVAVAIQTACEGSKP